LGQPATEASDRYALAVAAFELLAGERPFTVEPFTAQARQHVEQPPPLASERNETLPTTLDAVLTRGMAKQPDERFPSARELVDGIEQALTRPTKRAASARRASGASSLAVYSSHGRGRIVALAALGAVLLGVAIAAGVTLIPTASQSRSAAGARPLYAQHRIVPRAPVHAAGDQPHAAPRTHTTATTPTAPTTPPAPTTTTQPAPPVTPAVALEAKGHQLMLGGDYASAIPVLRQAVAAAPPSSLTYAYALYDLGRSLRLAGDPRAAVPILWRRLQIPNQTDVVRNELALALEALGQTQAGNAGAGNSGNGGTGGNAGNGGTGGKAGNAGTRGGAGDAGTGGSALPGNGAQPGGPSAHQSGGPAASAQALIGQAVDSGD
jgi:tetratricopeptide (TPR) repeat protein